MAKPGLLSVRSAQRAAARLALLCAGSTLAATTALAQGLTGGSVAAGSAQIGATVAGQTTITQSSSKAVINWQGFSVGSGEAVRFVQPDRNSVTLNRVIGGNVSKIDGSLSANGQVWLLNPNGVLIGNGGRISAAGFLATTRSLSDADFLAGRNSFSGDGNALIGNAGSISVDNGYAILAGGKVDNSGLVEANLGEVVLAAGKSFTLDLSGDKLISFAITTPLEVLPDGGAVSNSGTLRADGGRVLVTARSAAAIVDSVINMNGVVQARTADVVDGEIILDGGDAGTVNVAGTLDASGKASGQTGGRIVVLGDTIVAADTAKFDASGDAGGGEIYLGGGWQGASVLTGRGSATRVAVLSGASLDASAITRGNGGTIVAWSDVTNADSITRAYGTFNANAGAEGGDGGRIETSGHFLDTAGVKGSASSILGKGGEWLFDPYDINIVNTTAQNGSFDGSGNWTPTGSPSEVSTADIATRLNAGTNVTISTGLAGSAGADAGNIVFNAPLSATPASAVTLKLVAANQIDLSGSITASGGALNVLLEAGHVINLTGPAAFINTNGGNFSARLINGGTLSGNEKIDNGKSIQTGAGSIELRSTYAGGTVLPVVVTNGSTGQLQTTTGSITLAAGDEGIIDNLGALTTVSGKITFATGDGVSASLTTDSDGGTITTTSGNIELLAGADASIVSSAVIDTSGSLTISGGTGSQVTIQGDVTVGAGISVTAGQSILNTQTIVTNNSNLNFTLAGASSGVVRPSITNFGVINAGTGSIGMSATIGTITLRETAVSGGAITLNSDAIEFGNLSESGIGSLDGSTITIGANSLAIAQPSGPGHEGIFATTSIALAPLLASTDVCVADTGCGPGLQVSAASLSRLSAPLVSIGSAAGTGALTVNLVGAPRAGSNQTLQFRMGGTGGTATVIALPTVSTTDTVRIVAGGNLTLSSNFSTAVNGKLDLIAGSRFINSAGASALNSSGGGRWAIFSADPSLNTFGALTSGNVARWGVDYATAAAGGLSNIAVNSYAFGIKPEVIVTALNKSKTYGDALTIGSAQGSDYTVSGLVNPALYGNVFSPDTLGTVTLASAGGVQTANAGTYAITITPGFAPAGYTETAVNGTLTVNQRLLNVLLSGAITKTYDGTANAPLTSANYVLSNLANGNSFTIDQTSGTYSSLNVGTNIGVSASLIPANFLPGSGTLASNYVLPSAATGTSGIINARLLTATIINPVTKVYDGTGSATIAGTDIALTGFVAGQGATIANLNATYGTTISPIVNAGTNLAVNATLGASNLTANSGTLLSNYQVPTTISSSNGVISQRQLTASLIGNTTRPYDGTTSINLVAGNYSLANIVGSDDVRVNAPTTGNLLTKDAGTNKSITVSGLTLLGTAANNYTLANPTVQGAIGTVVQRQLNASLTGTVTKVYDQTNTAPVTNGNLVLSGFVSGEGATLGLANATYQSVNTGTNIGVSLAFNSGTLLANSGTSLSNYFLPGPIFANIGTITARPLAGTLIGTTQKIYDGTASATLTAGNFLITGFVGTDGATSTQTSGTFASPNAGTDLIVSTSVTLAPTGNTQLSNYLLPGQVSGAIGRIDPKTLTGSLTGTASKIYNASLNIQLTGANVALSGFVGTDGVTVGALTGLLAAADVGTAIATSATLAPQNVTPNGATLLGNYQMPSVLNGNISSVTPRPLSASLVGVATKIYDGSTTATLAPGNFQLTGFVQGQGASVTQTAGTYDSKNASNGIGVTATLSASDFAANQGTRLSNYVTPTLATGAIGRIDSRLLTVELVGPVSKTYDGSDAAFLTGANIAISGFVAGDGATVDSVSGKYVTVNAGTGIVVSVNTDTAVVSPTGTTILDNYDAPDVISAAIGVITQRPVTATLSGAISKVYDGSTAADLGAASYSLTNVLGGDLLSVSGPQVGSYDTANVGVRKLVTVDGLTLGGGSVGNYMLQSTSISARIGTINKRTLTAILTGTASKVYDGSTSASLTSANFSIGNLVAGETLTVAPQAGTYATRNAGTGIEVTATLGAAAFTEGAGTLIGNYTLPTGAVGSIGEILRRQLTATTAATTSKVYDATTAITLSANNLVIGNFADGEGATIGQATGNFASAGAGTSITISAALGAGLLTADSATNLSNYLLPSELTAARGSITVRPLTVALTGPISKTYDGTTAATLTAANYVLNNGIAGDSIGLNNPTAGTYNNKDAGTAKTVTVGGLALTGTAASNYALAVTSVAGAVGTILPKQLTAALTGTVSKVYDRTATAPVTAANVAISGFVAGESATVSSVGSSTYASVNAGTGLTVTSALSAGNLAAGGTTSLTNYEVPTSASGAVGTIQQKTATYIATAATRPQLQPNPTFTGTVDGLVATETVASATTGTLTFTSPADTASAQGMYPINGGGLTAVNYTFVQAPANATALTVAAPATSSAPVDVSIRPSAVTSTVSQAAAPVAAPAPAPAPAPAAAAPAADGSSSSSSSSSSGGGSDKPADAKSDAAPAASGSGGGGTTSTAPAPAPAASGGGGDKAPAPAPEAPKANALPPPPPVDPLPPSPVGDTKPATPADPADKGDPVLASAGGDKPPPPPGVGSNSVSVAPGVSVELPPSARSLANSADARFSETGDLDI